MNTNFTFCDNTFSDLVKEVYGTRSVGRTGHLSHYHDETPENKQKIWDDLCNDLEENNAAALAAEKASIKEFESLVQKTIGHGAGDRKTALRWLTQREEFYHGQCVEHFVWNQGILFTDYGRKLVQELIEITTFKEMEYD